MKEYRSPSRQTLASFQGKIFFSSFYGFFVNGGMALILGAVLPYMRISYQLDYLMLGVLISAHSIGSLGASFIAGVLPIYLGAKKSIVLLCSTGAIGFFLMATIGNYYFLILAFFLTGVNRGAVSNFSMTAVNQVATGEASISNILHGIFATGAFIAPFIAMGFSNIGKDGWKLAILLWGLLCFIELFIYASIKFPQNDITQKNKAKGKMDLGFFKNKFYITACGILFFYLCAEQALNGWVVTYFIESDILSANLAQAMSSLLWFVVLIGRLLMAYFSSRTKKSSLLLISGLGYFVFFVVLILSRNIVPVAIGIAGVGFCMSAFYPTTIASIGKILKEFPLALSFIMMISNIGAVIMPSIVGTVADHIGIIGGMSTVFVVVTMTLLFIIYNAYIYKDE